ncbi:hypothetical protein J4E90_011001 [Alternaria incomplexa]|uniref:uncharacterized protein n=1 Tax=Alternaria incomplexa TaxID=1187928 RepID=UPI002220C298|nr:uncharacterized protein J4E90_011001 [Alternaria incomplexa]KAI4906003.1 hypothetical protein J4E90_011001 [Alternaria incomplexa]
MVNWTADKDQVILKGIFKFHDIKSSAPLLKYLSEDIGGDEYTPALQYYCTPKAVSHRLSNIRKGGTTNANGGAVASPTRTASTPKTPRSRAKATPRKKKDVSEEVDSDGPQGLMKDDDVLSPAAARGKRTLNGKRKPTYDETSDKEEEDLEVEDVYVPMAKRVKEEPVEDEGIIVEELVDEEV